MAFSLEREAPAPDPCPIRLCPNGLVGSPERNPLRGERVGIGHRVSSRQAGWKGSHPRRDSGPGLEGSPQEGWRRSAFCGVKVPCSPEAAVQGPKPRLSPTA